MSLINHYKILEIPNYSTYAKVRKAYITKMKLYHPDLNKSPEAEELSKQINVAKEAIEKLNGTMEMESALTQGTKFTIMIPNRLVASK